MAKEKAEINAYFWTLALYFSRAFDMAALHVYLFIYLLINTPGLKCFCFIYCINLTWFILTLIW